MAHAYYRFREVSTLLSRYRMPRIGIVVGSAALLCVCTGVGVAQVYTTMGVPAQQTLKGPGTEQQESDRRAAAKVTLTVKDSSLLYVVTEIARQAKLKVVYRDAAKVLARRVNVKLVDQPVMEAFTTVLAGTGLISTLAPTGNTVGIRARDTTEAGAKASRVAGDETGVVAGRVTDSATTRGVEGAMVLIVGSGQKTVTDKDGIFQIRNVRAGSYVLTVKMFGYSAKSANVVLEAKVATVSLALSPTSSVLSEVVTTVTGQQRKLEIGNDITTLDVPEIMKQAPITSVTDLLEARVPGLTVMRTSGVPGAPSRIRLRGIGGGLLSGVPGAPTNDPIVVVDGIRVYAGQTGVNDQKLGGGKYPTPSPIDQIDPNSIEKIEVLRGPSAAAMYGSDAGDGVIVITTKKGKAGATRWDVAASGGIESMPGMYAAPGFYRFGHGPEGGIGNTPQIFCPQITNQEEYFRCSLDSLVRFQALNEPRLSTIGRGTSTRLSGTASGGANALMYSVTGSMANTQGLTKMPPLYQDLFRQLYDSAPSRRMRRPNTMDTKSGQASFSAELSRGLQATFTTSLMQSVQYQSSANDQLAALASVYMDTLNINPGQLGKYAYQLKSDAITANHALALNLLRWERLPLTATFGMNRVERSAQGLTPRGIVVFKAVDSLLTELSKGKFTERREHITTTTARITGTLFPRARTSLSLGSEITSGSNAAMDGYSDTLVQGVSRPSALVAGTRSGRSTTTGGWFLEPRLNLNSRFFVNPGFRIDGGGVSGSRGGFRGGLFSLFPKLNFSWIAIDREGGEPLWGMVSLVRPRLAFGIAGVQPAAEWSLRTLEQDVGSWIPSVTDSIAPDAGLRLRSVGNTQLGPEKTQEVEGGFDLQLWDTRVTVSATGFYKMRKNAIQQLPLAPSVGAMLPGSDPLSYYANIGHVRNAGAEFTLNAMVLDLPAIGWTVDVSVSKYTNKLVKLFGEQSRIDLGNGTSLVEGYPLFGRWSRPISGWTDPNNGTKLWYGDYVVADSAVYMGMQAPDFEMPFRTSLTLFRGLLSVNGQFNYKAGLTQRNLGGANLLGNIYENTNSTYGQQAYALAAACFSESGSFGGPCTDYGFIQKVNSLRFNSVSVGYNVPRAYLKRFLMSSLSLSLQGSNIGLWTNYRGKDPDVNGTLIGDATQDSGQLPMPRAWSLQIRIGT